MKKQLQLMLIILFVSSILRAQQKADTLATTHKLSAKEEIKETFKPKDHTFNYNFFSQLYPIRDNPSIGYLTSYVKQEHILFNAYPVLTLSFFNNFKKKLRDGKLFSQGYCFIFRPQVRMYTDSSSPVKMPSYKVGLGLQHLFRISQHYLVSYSIESGHYSNGQSGSAIAGGGTDGSKQSDSLLAALTPHSNLSALINRTNGDFSTNLTELMANFRFIPELDDYKRPKQVHSFTAGAQLYHKLMFGFLNFGGYEDEYINIYGKWRFYFAYAYNYSFKKGYRITASENLEVIQGAYPTVNPVRSVLQATFFLPQSLGFYVNYIYGHDDYNLRLVDSGNQFGVGITWDMFPPVEIGEGVAKKVL